MSSGKSVEIPWEQLKKPERPIGYYDKPISFWQRLPHRSDTGGVSPIFLEGRERYVAERMRGMTPERRAYRKQWLHDQILSPREPVYVEQLYTELNNPFRRFFNYPFRKLHLALAPKLGYNEAYLIKSIAQLGFWFLPMLYIGTFIAMHWRHDWSHARHGLRIQYTKPSVQPDDPSYPFTSTKKFDDYASFGYKQSALYKTEDQIRAEAAKSELALKK